MYKKLGILTVEVKMIVWGWDTIPYKVYLKRPKLLTYEILFLCGWLIWLGGERTAVSWWIGILKTCRWVLGDYMLTKAVPSGEWLLGRRLSTSSECQGTQCYHISHPKVRLGRLSVRASPSLKTFQKRFSPGTYEGCSLFGVPTHVRDKMRRSRMPLLPSQNFSSHARWLNGSTVCYCELLPI